MLLVDFGDTLADESWMLSSHGDLPGWREAYGPVAAAASGPWGLGTMTAGDVAGRVAAVLGVPTARVLEHMRLLCTHIEFHPSIMGALRTRRARGQRQALVTVNPDLFSEVVVGRYGLTDLFDVIVTSWENGTDDKVELCRLALQRFDPPVPAARAVLIDNIGDNVDRFRSVGGRGYVFAGDRRFADDLRHGRVPGFAAN